MKLWISAGEVSGDIQGGALLAELRRQAPDIEAVGMGGDELARAGQNNLFSIRELSVMGVSEVIGSLPRILKLLSRVKAALKAEKPDAVLVIDSPDFNFRVAKMAAKLGIAVYYFIPPKVWAWRSGRVEFLRRHTRKVLSILPFEVEFYQERGLDVAYVGNPLVDLVDYERIKRIRPVSGRIGLMPGSRKKEVESLLPAFAAMADLVEAKQPGLTYHALVAPNFQPDYLRGLWTSRLPLVLEQPENRYEFMRTCQFMVAASGTATLESALAGVPTIVAYKAGALTYALGRAFLNVSWISLPNLVLNRTAFPEHIQNDADPAPLASRLESWLADPSLVDRVRQDMDEIRIRCGEPGSATRAARELLHALNGLNGRNSPA